MSDGVSRDTTLEAERVQIGILRRRGMLGRGKITAELCQNVRDIAAEGVRERHPDYDERQVKLAVIKLTLGPELFRLAYPNVEIQP